MNELIGERLNNYKFKNAIEEQNAIKEITQEIILYALSKTKFFDHAFFIGGTALRIVHGLNRFSEDLDFSTVGVQKDFQFEDYMDDVLSILRDYDLNMVVTKGKDDGFIKARAFKEDSEKWKLTFPNNQRLKKITIKLEIDTNPPDEAVVDRTTLDFPVLHQIKIANLETLFAGKINALLTRNYIKGRDWYDFLWYMKNKVKINYGFLTNSLPQMDAYKGKSLKKVDRDFIVQELVKKAESLDWKQVSGDVERFVRQDELQALSAWDKDLFLDRINII